MRQNPLIISARCEFSESIYSWLFKMHKLSWRECIKTINPAAGPGEKCITVSPGSVAEPLESYELIMREFPLNERVV